MRKCLFATCALLFAAQITMTAQVASHAPTGVGEPRPQAQAKGQTIVPQASDRPVARVNGVTLSDRDLLREMYTIFPYARQHNGFPKGEEASIRKGALEMIIFEELVFQQANKQKLTIPKPRVDKALAAFKDQFHTPDEYRQYLQSEMQGSEERVRQTIVRSLLIERMLKNEVEAKAVVTPVQVRAYYDKTPKRFEQPESFSIQSISILPPVKPTPEQANAARKQADDALTQAKKTKTAEEFGMLAERISQDDFRVQMGEHKPIAKAQLPPALAHTLEGLKPGQITGVVQIESGYTIIRLNKHITPGKIPFDKVKATLGTELQKDKYEKTRVAYDKRLRAGAKIDLL
jgi:parvulin-like peptidyl-prolyl isomerase